MPMVVQAAMGSRFAANPFYRTFIAMSLSNPRALGEGLYSYLVSGAIILSMSFVFCSSSAFAFWTSSPNCGSNFL